MAEITIKQIEDENEWESFISRHSEANFLHSWYWGELHKNLNRQVDRTGFYDDEKLVGVMLSIVEPAKRGRYLTVPGGPIIDWRNSNLISKFASQIKKIAKDRSCVFVRVRPQLISDEFSKNMFKNNGFADAPLHLHAELTSQLDITKTEEELLANMRKTTRYELKKAGLLNIEVKTSKDPHEIRNFYNLQLDTAQRQKFIPFSLEFLYEQFKAFAQNDLALLFSAFHKKTLLAQAFVIFYGQEAVYHYGASTTEGRKYPGSYLIQWEAIREAKKRGLRRYNFWGVAPENRSNHRFYGVSVFKRGFGGEDIEYLHAQDFVINKPKYLFNWIIEQTRKKIRRV